MKIVSTPIALVGATIILASCASLTPPTRPDYTGSDDVQSAQTQQLVGKWAVSELNPLPQTEPQTTLIEYRSDGTVTGLITPSGEGLEALGNLQFELSGNWTLEADVVTHQNITMSSTRDDTLGSMISNMVNNQKGIAGQANIYELSADRIVMVGSDGAAMEYVRQ